MEIASTRIPIFEVPVWRFDLTELLGEIEDELVEAALEVTRLHPAVNRPFAQSTADLGGLSDLWADVIEVFRQIVSGLLSQVFVTIDGVERPVVGPVKCWVLRIEDQGAWDREASRMRIMHNHPGPTLSSVLFLRGPADPESSGGGTIFRNPLAHVTDPRFMPPTVRVPWQPLHMIVFPSWLEHGPDRPGLGKGPRITVAADYYT